MKYPLVKKLLQGRIGLKIEALGEALVDRVIASEIHRLGLDSDDGYHRVLQTTPEAFEMLTEQVVVHETWFFRDTAPFNLLKKHVEENKPPAGRRDGILKVLSAPCSTGEEPYDISGCVKAAASRVAEAFTKKKPPTRTQISAMKDDPMTTFAYAFSAEDGKGSLALYRLYMHAYDLNYTLEEVEQLINDINYNFWIEPMDENRLEKTVLIPLRRKWEGVE